MTAPAQPIRLYHFALSGHAHRVRLMCALLGLPVVLEDVDLLAGAQKTPAFLARNPFGQVPVIEDGETCVADSNAILLYLVSRYAEDERWYPADALTRARIQQWFSAAAGPLAKGPASARWITISGSGQDTAEAVKIAAGLFQVMDDTLAKTDFLVGEAPTVADIAMYTYTAHAPEGGIPLTPYPHIQAWLARIEALPGFVPMQATPAAA